MMKKAIIPALLLCAFAQMAAVSAVDTVKPPAAPAAPGPFVNVDSVGKIQVLPLTNSKEWDKKVSIDIKDQPLGGAVRMLLKDTGIICVVDPQIIALKVTAVLRNVARRDAFMEIVKAAGAVLTERDSSGTLLISPTQPYSYLARALESQIAGLTEQLSKVRAANPGDENAGKVLQGTIDLLRKQLDEERNRKPGTPSTPNWFFSLPSAPGKGGVAKVFTIQYINPAELVPLIYSLGARQVTVVSGGKLVVNGTEEAVQQAAEVIRQVDTEEALPRPVTVKIRATYLVTDETGKNETLESSTSGTVAEGQPIKLSTVAAPRNDEFLPGLLLDIQLLPEVGVGDQVTLVGAVAMPAPEKPEIKMSDTPVAVTIKSGSSAVISEGSFDISGGKLEFKITADVTVGKERLKTRTKGGFGGGEGSLIAPGLGGYQGMGIFSGDSECFDPTQWSAAGGFGGVMGAAATQWNGALDIYGRSMDAFGQAMDAAANAWQGALGGLNGGGGMGGFGGTAPGSMGGGGDLGSGGGGMGGYGQDSDIPDCSSGGGGGGV